MFMWSIERILNKNEEFTFFLIYFYILLQSIIILTGNENAYFEDASEGLVLTYFVKLEIKDIEIHLK